MRVPQIFQFNLGHQQYTRVHVHRQPALTIKRTDVANTSTKDTQRTTAERPKPTDGLPAPARTYGQATAPEGSHRRGEPPGQRHKEASQVGCGSFATAPLMAPLICSTGALKGSTAPANGSNGAR